MLHTSEKIIKHKVGLLNLAEELGNVSKACQVMGLSRDTFYRYKSAVEEGGLDGLLEKSRRKPNLKNRVDEKTEAAVVDYALAFPAHGQTHAVHLHQLTRHAGLHAVAPALCRMGKLTPTFGFDPTHVKGGWPDTA